MTGQKLILSAIAGMGLTAFATTGRAATVESHFVLGNNEILDVSREYLIDRNTASGVGGIDIGDSFRGLAQFKTVNGDTVGRGTLTNEFTAIFQVLVTSVTAIPLPAGGFDISVGFSPDPTFAEAAALGLAGRAMIIMHQDAASNSAVNFTDSAAALTGLNLLPDDGTANVPPHTTLPGFPHSPPDSADVSTPFQATENAFIATASDGPLFWAMGFTGAPVPAPLGLGPIALPAPGEGWETTGNNPGPPSVLPFFGVTSTTALASINFSLNRLFTGAIGDSFVLTKQLGNIPGNPGLVDFVGSSDINGVSNIDTPFETADQTQINFTIAQIPLPASVWSGLALMGAVMGGSYIRSRRRA